MENNFQVIEEVVFVDDDDDDNLPRSPVYLDTTPEASEKSDVVIINEKWRDFILFFYQFYTLNNFIIS